jgi:hypothetical protein
MRTATLIAALFASAAVALPSTPIKHDSVAFRRHYMDQRQATGPLAPRASPGAAQPPQQCELLKCAAALGPTAVSCTGSVLEEGVNPIADAGCIAGVVANVANPPSSCSACG